MRLSIWLCLLGVFLASCQWNNQQNQPNTVDFEELVDTYEPPNRDIWQKPALVFNLLDDLSTKTVADIGAGTGYFSVRLAPKAKRVLSLEIDPQFIAFIDSVKYTVLPKAEAERIETRLVEPMNPELKVGEVDAALIVNTFGYIENKVRYLEILKKGLSSNGLVLIIDYKSITKQDIPKSTETVFIPFTQVEKDLELAGYDRLLTDNRSLEFQYIILAQKRAN